MKTPHGAKLGCNHWKQRCEECDGDPSDQYNSTHDEQWTKDLHRDVEEHYAAALYVEDPLEVPVVNLTCAHRSQCRKDAPTTEAVRPERV